MHYDNPKIATLSSEYLVPKWDFSGGPSSYGNEIFTATAAKTSGIGSDSGWNRSPPVDNETTKNGRGYVIDNPDIKRLEDRIDAVNREGQLRLDASMAKMDGKIDAALARIDGKFDRMMASMQHMDQSVSEISSRVTGMRSIIFGTAIASTLAIVGAIFAGQALWASGFSSGQTDRPSVSGATK